MIDWLPGATRLSPWSQVTVVVAGLAASGYAAADGLLELGAKVIVLDDADTPANAENGPERSMVAMLTRQSKLCRPAPGGQQAISRVLPPPFFHGVAGNSARANRCSTAVASANHGQLQAVLFGSCHGQFIARIGMAHHA